MSEQMRQKGKGGIWYANCRYMGIPLSDCLGTSDRRIAERRLAEIKFSVERGDYQRWKKKFEDVAAEYIEKVLPQKSKSAVVRYHGVVVKHLIPFFKGRRVNEIDQASVVDYKLRRESEGAIEGTIRKELQVIKQIMKLVEKTFKLPTIQDFPLMQYVNKEKKITSFLEEEDLLGLIARLEEKYKPIAMIAAYTGLRISNVLDLRYGQVDLFGGWVKVENTKNGDPVRVPVCGKLMDVLKQMVRDRSFHDDRLFCEINIRAFQKAWKRAKRQAGYEGWWPRVHDLRHFCGSYLANSGVRLEVIAEILNHRDLRSTRRYSHFSDRTLKEAVSVFDIKSEKEKAGVAKS